jgi:hypothetical protein
MGALLAGGRKIVGILHGFAALVGAGLVLACAGSIAPTSAQILDPPAAQADRPRPARLRPTLPDDSTPLADQDQGAFDSGAFGAEGAPQAAAAAPAPQEDGVLEPGDALRPSLSEDASAWSADTVASEDSEASADGSGPPLSGDEPVRRRLLQDGDPVPVIEEAAVQDGVAEVVEAGVGAAAAEGGEDATEVDMRSPEDVRAFVGQSAGYDPLLLQADETNPVFSPSNFQGFILDPFQPVGTKIGSFLLFTTLEADYDFNNNIFASPSPEGDSAFELRPAIRLASNWSRHAFEFRSSGDLSFHDRFPSEDDRAFMIETLGRLDITSRSNLQGLYAHEFAQESRSAINAETAGTRPNITVDRVRAAYNQRFNRLSVQLRGNIIDTSYSSNIFAGQVQSNADRDYTLYEQGIRPRWEFSPYLFAFTDISFNQRDYSLATFTDGILRSSTGERYRAGVSFGDVSQVLRGNVSLGYGHQVLDNHELPAVDGLLVDADLAWQVTPITVLSFTASSDVAETTTAYSPGVFERNYGLEARHSFTRYFVGSVGLGYMTREFVNVGINEEQLTAGVGTEYYWNPWTVLFTRYQHTDFQSSQPDSSYSGEEVQAGIRLRH